ncbi:hypothetical protein HPG69_009788 [Diceros bicornis minor]|uniref:Essential protein Yae1 N-terminal domain-containing protein n=1 Tax=Diceros bicornis minor TaxID=77932 RepID=A0A7J7EB52_DICBM|nr:hypothetical protein HPG69_009788 [Diceros bicornis minor]
MAGSRDMFDAIVMADERWVAGLGRDPDPPPQVRAQRPGWGVPRAWASAERPVAPKAAGTCGAEMVLILLYSSALRARLPRPGLPRASARPDDRLPPGTPRPRVERTPAIWALPLFLVHSGGPYGGIHGQADSKCVRRHRFPFGAPGEPLGRFHEEGYQEGYEEGSNLGIIEGRQHGTLHGAKIGSEIGCYQGFAFAWRCLLHSSATERDSTSLLAPGGAPHGAGRSQAQGAAALAPEREFPDFLKPCPVCASGLYFLGEVAIVVLMKGFAIGRLIHVSENSKCCKKMKVVESLIGMIQKFPYDDPTYDKLHEDLDRIRGKFKQLCSLLNVQPDFKISAQGSGLSF